MWKWVVQQDAAGSESKLNMIILGFSSSLNPKQPQESSGCVDLLYKSLEVKTVNEVQCKTSGIYIYESFCFLLKTFT